MATLEMAASVARTVTGQSSAIPTASRDRISVLADVTAVSGTTPSMTLSIEWSHDGTTWFVTETADAFTAITAVAKKAKDFNVKGDFARLVWTISGTTPSFTFSARMWLNNNN